MTASHLEIELLSETTFVGNSVAGDVDIDVNHDPLGIPTIPGTTVKRLLAGNWNEMSAHFDALAIAGPAVFGRAQEAGLRASGMLDVGDATIGSDAVDWIRWNQYEGRLDRHTTLQLFTVDRHQTAVDTTSGAPARGSLRKRRAVLRGTTFTAPIHWLQEPDDTHRQVLALAALATRHGGQSRNRGAGHLRITIAGDLAETRRLAGVLA